jgi:putative alpha-1,2-mannosidase
MEVSTDGTISRAHRGSGFTGKEVKLIFTRSKADVPLLARVGSSPVSVEGAAQNLQTEMSGWDFDTVTGDTARLWATELAELDASFSSEELTQTFYSAYYHSLVAPATYSDADGAFRGQDRKNHPNPGFTKYTTLSIWDIYRGEFPFLTLTQPKRVNDIVRTLMLDYEQLGQHSLPMWPLWGNET